MTNRLSIPKCNRNEFGVDSGTDNFSPHLGETASFTLGLTGCTHDTPDGWLEGEVMRETTAGCQHVGWLDMMPSESGHQKRRQCLEGPQTIDWDGIATEGAALAKSPAVFTNGKSPFHRALPQVISGEPVPPPYYTLFFRYREENSDSAEILDESWFNVYVPQVVKVEMTDKAYDDFNAPIFYPGTFCADLLGATNVVGCETNTTLYEGCTNISKAQLCDRIVQRCISTYTSVVNIRFTTDSALGRIKTLEVKCASNFRKAPLGECATIADASFRNSNPAGTAFVYMNVIRSDSSDEKYYYDNDGMSPEMRTSCEIETLFPFSDTELANAVASTTVHETGHLLGLVSKEFLGGTAQWHNNNSDINGWIMNRGGITPAVYHLGSHTNRLQVWKTNNLLYLQFILPKGN